MGVVETDVNRGAASGRDHVAGRVTGVEGSDCQGGSVEVVGAVVQRGCGQPVHQSRECWDRILGAMRISRMALHAGGCEIGRHRASTPDLNHLAHPVGAGRLADNTYGHRFALRCHPIQNGDGSVGCQSFFVAGNSNDYCAIRRRVRDEINRGGCKCGDPGFHVCRPPTPKLAIADRAAERIVGPVRRVANRHHIGVAVETECPGVVLCAPAGEQVWRAVAIDACAGKAA